MYKLKLCYFGTPDFSAQFLEKIITDTSLPIEVILVVTQPDKPVSRKQILTPSPVKVTALKYKIKVIESITHDSRFMIHEDIDLGLLYAYGEIIPSALLKTPKHGFWNIHPSLLPKYRGASPIAYPLILGDPETGITLMQMDEELDHGPIIAQEKYTILPTDIRSDLEIKLTDLGFELFKKTIAHNHAVISNSPTVISSGTRDPIEISPLSVRRNDTVFIEQNHTLATYTRRLTKQDGFIPLSTLKKALNNESITFDQLPKIIKEYLTTNKNTNYKILNTKYIIYNLFRGLAPWPGIWTLLPDDKRLKIADIELINEKLIINKVQLEGKKEIVFKEFQKTHTTF